MSRDGRLSMHFKRCVREETSGAEMEGIKTGKCCCIDIASVISARME